MEHLYFSPSTYELEREADRLAQASILNCDWTRPASLPVGIEWPQFRWLEFPHRPKATNFTLRSFQNYAEDYGQSFRWNGSYDRQHLRDSAFNVRLHTLYKAYFLGDLQSMVAVVSLLQSWLVFGFLEHFFNKPMTSAYLVRQDTRGGGFIDTRNLTYLLYAQDRFMRSADVKQRQESSWNMGFALENQEELLQYIRTFCADGTKKWFLSSLLNVADTLLDRSSPSAPHGTVQTSAADSTICKSREEFFNSIRSVLVLGHLVRDIAMHNYVGWWTTLNITPPAMMKPFKDRPLLQGLPVNKLLNAGFCPRLITQLLDGGLSYSSWAWFAAWGGRSPIPRLEDHSVCTRKSCALDADNRVLRHDHACPAPSTCFIRRPNRSVVYKSLEQGSVPLLQLYKERSSPSWQLRVVPRQDLSTTNFVAFSHVWRQGRGSTTEAGLPECHLQTIFRALDMFDFTYPKSTLFWIDSLCIPRDAKNRSSSLRQINSVFKHAAKTLVLDRALLSLSKRGLSREDFLAAELCSAWRTRMWTWLEFHCAKSVSFVMKDGLSPELRFGRLEKDLTRGPQWAQHLPSQVPEYMQLVQSDLLRHVSFATSFTAAYLRADWLDDPPDRWDARLDFNGVAGRAMELLKILTNRTVSKADDAALIIGHALALKMDVPASRTGDERMRALYITMSKFPMVWAFLGLPRLDTAPFTWAPKTLMLDNALRQRLRHPALTPLPEPQVLGTVTEEGLDVTLSAVVFGERTDWSTRCLRLRPMIFGQSPEHPGRPLFFDVEECQTQKEEDQYQYSRTISEAEFDLIAFARSDPYTRGGIGSVYSRWDRLQSVVGAASINRR